MIPEAFKISISGDGESAVPVRFTVGPGVIFIAVIIALALIVKARK